MTRFHHLEYLDVSGDNCHSAVKKRRNVRANDSYNRKITYNLIRSLKVLKGSCGVTQSASWYFSTPLSLGKTDSLRVVDMSFNGIYHCTGLLADSGLENITVLNISGWDCSQLSPAFLSKLPGLEVLEVELLRLNKGLESDKGGIFLRQQEKLKTLNMAKNELTDLHPELFSSLSLVQSLNLANNKFMSIPRALRSMTSLTYLDISYNSLVTLDTADREWLEQVLYLNLYGNPLSCICSTLDFVLWLLDTDIHIELKNNLTCTLKDGTKTLLANLNSTVKDMKVACVSRFWLTFSVSISAVSVLAVCISVVYYRYRHNIKYWFLTKCRRGATYEEVPLDDNEYDAFVAYNHEDYRWACHTLREFLEDDHRYRLCLHHRDFPAGESIQGNIVDAINTSRKIILVISKKYLACNWAEFEIQMAGMRMVQCGRNDVVITIMLEEIPVREMPRALLRMWRNITFLLWTNDPGDQNLFWGRLSEAMART